MNDEIKMHVPSQDQDATEGSVRYQARRDLATALYDIVERRHGRAPIPSFPSSHPDTFSAYMAAADHAMRITEAAAAIEIGHREREHQAMDAEAAPFPAAPLPYRITKVELRHLDAGDVAFVTAEAAGEHRGFLNTYVPIDYAPLVGAMLALSHLPVYSGAG